MINVPKEIIKDMGMYVVLLAVMIPVMMLITSALLDVANGIDRDNLPPEAQANYDQVVAMSGMIPVILIVVMVIFTLLRSNAYRIIRTANIEKRMEKLKKLGADKFIDQTKAELIHSSERGNNLYKTKNVINGRELKFLVYNDKSTDRQYVSFVDESHLNADEAMASKFSLSQSEYTMLKKENES